ncbi:MAG TPA: TolC family protein [Bryobacteraceae bacterium]|nr:TolC family protein [Bryobacteraceae bacterium]
MKHTEFPRRLLAVILACACAAPAWPQAAQPIAPVRPQTTVILRPYEAPSIPAVRPSNTLRVRDLIRGGKLYLTAQDAIALALENNIDLESARYNPLIDEWNLERLQAGGALPGVPSGASQAGSVASGQGVSGAQTAAGVSITGGGNSNANSSNATISQIGPVTPSLDPTFQTTQTFSHRSILLPNLLLSGIYNVIDKSRANTTSITEGLITGGQVSLTYKDSYLNENADTDVLNPSSSVSLSFSIQHNFLQGFGVAVNTRNIVVAKNTLAMSDTVFKGQVISVVAEVLNLYYGLVADYEDLKAKQSALNVAQIFFENNKKQVQIGTMAPLDVTTAEAQVASSQQDLVISQTTLEQQQVSLKNVLSRNGLADPLFAEAEIIPLDRIDVPEQDNLPPLKDLIATARKNRTDLAIEENDLKNSQITALGTANGVLPQLAGLASASNQGLSGSPQPVPVTSRRQFPTTGPLPTGFGPCPANIAPGKICEIPDEYFLGGIGTALGQVFRRNFPTERAGAFIAPTLRNRQANADATIDQLTVRQNELQLQKNVNQLAVDVSNQIVGLQQARSRYQAAVRNRILEQQLLDAEQKKFSLGASTTANVVQQQRDLATAQSSEVAALVTYSNARVSLDETLGTTLETNHVTVQEALSGRISRPSTLPATLPSSQ